MEDFSYRLIDANTICNAAMDQCSVDSYRSTCMQKKRNQSRVAAEILLHADIIKPINHKHYQASTCIVCS